MKRPAKRPAKPATKGVKTSVAAAPTLAQRIADAPRLAAPKEARAEVQAWLGEVGRTTAGKALERVLADAPKALALLAGLAESSPYLWDLASAEPARLRTLLDADPDAHFASLLAETAVAMEAMRDEEEAMR